MISLFKHSILNIVYARRNWISYENSRVIGGGVVNVLYHLVNVLYHLVNVLYHPPPLKSKEANI